MYCNLVLCPLIDQPSLQTHSIPQTSVILDKTTFTWWHSISLGSFVQFNYSLYRWLLWIGNNYPIFPLCLPTPPEFEPRPPGNENQCTANELCWPPIPQTYLIMSLFFILHLVLVKDCITSTGYQLIVYQISSIRTNYYLDK